MTHTLALLLAASAPLAWGFAATRAHGPEPFRASALAGTWTVLAAAGLALVGLGSGWVSTPGPAGVRADAVTALLLALVGGLGGVVVRYSETALRGDRRRARYARAMAGALASVTALLVTNHLVVFAVAWTATSLCLHRLLTHFEHRREARLAAHKKFALSRFAEVLLALGVGAIGWTAGDLTFDGIAAAAGAGPLPAGLQLGALCLAMAVVLRTAQLPFHGWLTQVMEAPTAVSALLHAGVVNLGGILMIRLAPLMVHAEAAQALLVTAGALTAVIGGLVMTTRVSVKVNLAWSTIAQMGFMLVQCGLGAHPLALLHLVAHSCYKAHAFLSAGSAVDRWRTAHAEDPLPTPGLGLRFGAAALSVVAVAALASGFGVDPLSEPVALALATVLALAITPLVVDAARGWRVLPFAALTAVGVAALTFAWHAALGVHGVPTAAAMARAGVVVVAFGLGFGAQAWLAADPRGAVARRLHAPLFAGLWLDDLFTRALLRAWPLASEDRR